MVDLHGTWSRGWKGLGAHTAGDALFTTLLAKYDEPHRHYHSRQHLIECLQHFDAVRHLPVHAAEVEVALWFHDAIYDLQRSDNEARSADWARTRVPGGRCAGRGGGPRAGAHPGDAAHRGAHRSGRTGAHRHRSGDPGRAVSALRRVRTADPRRSTLGCRTPCSSPGAAPFCNRSWTGHRSTAQPISTPRWTARRATTCATPSAKTGRDPRRNHSTR